MNSVCKKGLGRSGDRSGERFDPDCGMQRNPHRPNPLLLTILLRPLLLSRTQPLRGGPASPTRFGEELFCGLPLTPSDEEPLTSWVAVH